MAATALSLSLSLSHSLIHSLTHSLTRSLTRSLTHLLTRSLTHSRAHSCTHSPNYSLTHLLILLLTHSRSHAQMHAHPHALADSHAHALIYARAHSHTLQCLLTHWSLRGECDTLFQDAGKGILCRGARGGRILRTRGRARTERWQVRPVTGPVHHVGGSGVSRPVRGSARADRASCGGTTGTCHVWTCNSD